MIDSNLEERITELERALGKANEQIAFLASVLSRYQFADPRFFDPPIAVLDRLDNLERRNT